MFFLQLLVKSKNNKSLKFFFKYFKVVLKKKVLNLNLAFFTNAIKKQCKKKFSVLTSPQANKNAQEQFVFKIYTRQITLTSFKIFKLLVLFKKIYRTLFSTIKFQLTFLLANKNKLIDKTLVNLINPETYLIRLIKTPLLRGRRK